MLAPGDLARITFFVTNTTTAPVVLGYRYAWNYGDSRVHVRSTEPTTAQPTAGESAGFLASPDVWSFNGGNGTLNAGVAWGITGQPFFATTPSHSGFDAAAVELLPSAGRTIAAGETVGLAFFHILDAPALIIDNPDEAAAPAPTETVEPVEPVETIEPAAAPELAVTGAGVDEHLLMGGLAAALLGVGASLLMVRRFTSGARS